MENIRGLMGLGKLQGLQSPLNTTTMPAANVTVPNATTSLPAQTMQQPETVWSRLAHLLLDKYLAEEE